MGSGLSTLGFDITYSYLKITYNGTIQLERYDTLASFVRRIERREEIAL